MISPSPSKCLLKAIPSPASRRRVGQRVLSILKPRPAKVFAVEFDQIEGTEHGGVVAKPITESVEYREAAFVDHDGLTVHDARSHRQARDRVDDLREACREIVAIAGEQAHAFGVAARNDAETVVLDLVNPACPFRRLLGWSRQAGKYGGRSLTGKHTTLVWHSRFNRPSPFDGRDGEQICGPLLSPFEPAE